MTALEYALKWIKEQGASKETTVSEQWAAWASELRDKFRASGKRGQGGFFANWRNKKDAVTNIGKVRGKRELTFPFTYLAICLNILTLTR